MSEADFFPASGGTYRGSKYPGFTGGTTNPDGSVQPVGASANVSQATGNNATPTQVQQQQVDTGNTAAQTGGTLGTDPTQGGSPTNAIAPSSALNQQTPPTQTLGDLALQGALPAVGDIAGTGAGAALGVGASLGGAVSAGGNALNTAGNNLLSGNFSGLLGTSSGSGAGAGVGAAGSSVSSAGVTDGLQSFNVGTAPVDQLGSDAVSQGAGASAASDAGSIGGSLGSGLGTFAADLLSGQGVEKSAISGIGGAAGAYLGSFAGPIGTIVGGFLGSQLGGLFGNSHPTVGPNGDTLLTVTGGQLGVGTTGADNGADPNNTINVANQSTAAINKILSDNNLQIDPTKLTPFNSDAKGQYYNGLSISQGSVNNGNPGSALDVWNNLLKANAIVSKTPLNNTSSTPNAITTVNGSTPPVTVPGAVTTNPVIPLTGYLPT